jgi:hypothetical protein
MGVQASLSPAPVARLRACRQAHTSEQEHRWSAVGAPLERRWSAVGAPLAPDPQAASPAPGSVPYRPHREQRTLSS